jgi:beta-lysine 5,6-aminomutase alpha subunit
MQLQGIIINTGEDNYLTTSDAYEEAHTVLASQFINEQFALQAGLPEEQMGLGHAFEMNPDLKNSFLYEYAQAQMARQIFPNAPSNTCRRLNLKRGISFRGYIQDAYVQYGHWYQSSTYSPFGNAYRGNSYALYG